MTDKKDLPAAANPDLVTKPGDKQSNLKMAVDYGPVVLFGLTFFIAKVALKMKDPTPMMWASGALAGASVVAVIAGLLLEKRIAWIPLIAAILGIPFAILTVVFHNEVFIKIKMTIVDVLIGGALLGARAIGKQPLKALLGEAIPLKDQAWGPLTIYYGLFYLVMAGINEFVWRTQTDSVWVTWKLASIIGGPVLLTLTLIPFFMKNMIMTDTPDDLPKDK